MPNSLAPRFKQMLDNFTDTQLNICRDMINIWIPRLPDKYNMIEIF